MTHHHLMIIETIEITICLYGEKPCQKFVYLNAINISLSLLIASYAINNFYKFLQIFTNKLNLAKKTHKRK